MVTKSYQHHLSDSEMGGWGCKVVCKVLHNGRKNGLGEILVGKEESWKVPAEAD